MCHLLIPEEVEPSLDTSLEGPIKEISYLHGGAKQVGGLFPGDAAYGPLRKPQDSPALGGNHQSELREHAREFVSESTRHQIV